MRLIWIIVLVLVTAESVLAGSAGLERIDTRPGVKVSFYYMKRDGAKATVLLVSGGDGDIKIKNGVPTSKNFLVRSRELFASNGLNVAVFDKKDSLFRCSTEHIEDLRILAAYLKKDAKVPVWIIGTSMGTISATAVATGVTNDELAGIVLTSSITSREAGAVTFQKLDAIQIPVLLVHHEFDACRICEPGDVSEIFRRLKNAKIKKEIYFSGGSVPKGNPCQALHYHGFVGIEKEVVDKISAWITNPVL